MFRIFDLVFIGFEISSVFFGGGFGVGFRV